MSLSEQVACFKLDDARCYDPNEERRLRRGIAAAPGGAEQFQSKIRMLAASINTGKQAGLSDQSKGLLIHANPLAQSTEKEVEASIDIGGN